LGSQVVMASRSPGSAEGNRIFVIPHVPVPDLRALLSRRWARGELLALALSALACAGAPHADCRRGLEIDDAGLGAALQRSIASRERIAPWADADAYARYIEDALRKTFDEDIVALADRRTCAVYWSGESQLAIHALRYDDRATADRVVALVRARSANTLQIEALAYYTFVPARNTLLFLVADRESYAEHRALFEEIRSQAQTDP